MAFLFVLIPYSISAQSVYIKGKVEGLKEGQRILLMRIDEEQKPDTLVQTRCDAQGGFNLKSTIVPDIFSLKIANRSVFLLLQGGETVDIKAKMKDFNLVSHQITGSLYDKDMEQWKNLLQPEPIATYLEKTSDVKPLFHLFLLQYITVERHQNLYQKVLKELKKSLPKSHHITNLSKLIKVTPKSEAQVTIGHKAPNIKLPNPDGKVFALSKLRGKVVLVDFWASWCKPCRINNKSLKDIYYRHRAKGFECFSVSLDGASQQPNKESNNSREKWREAIQKDQLGWKYHVSDLLGWSSTVCHPYALKTIPQNFLLDKKGIVRYANLNGSELDRRIRELLLE